MKHILVVDDDVVAANTVAAVLRDYHVTVAHDGTEALALAARLPMCDLVITDYLMPTMAGDELAGLIQARQPTVKTLLLTGYGDLIGVEKVATDAWMAKPFEPRALRHAVSALIGAA